MHKKKIFHIYCEPCHIGWMWPEQSGGPWQSDVERHIKRWDNHPKHVSSNGLNVRITNKNLGRK